MPRNDDAERGQIIRIISDDDDLARDGETVRTRLTMMDSVRFGPDGPRFMRSVEEAALHQPGYRDAASNSSESEEARDAARAARDAYVRDLTSAWRTPPARDAATDPGETDPDAAVAIERRQERERSPDAARAAAYEQYKREI